MTVWTPEYRVKANGTNVTGVSLVGFSIIRGRQDINSPALAGVCQINLINFENTIYPFTINTSLTIEVKDSSGAYVFLFGGRVSDLATEVTSTGSIKTVTRLSITAVGLIARLARVLYDGSLAEDTDGNQIKALLYAVGADQWNEVPTAETWATYDATQTWETTDAYFGEFDPGVYTMRSQTLTNAIISTPITAIAQSAGGYIYEDNQGRICYADADHRSDALIANGYTELDARYALGAGISTVKRQGDVVNKFTINHGVNFSSSHTSENTSSQAEFGIYGQSYDSYLKNSADVTDFADRLINLRAYPFDRFQQIIFPVQSPEIDDATRDALLGIYMGQPIRISNLPGNIVEGQFEGFVEGWSWRSTVSGLTLTLNASPTNFSAISQRWEQVNVAESWNTINTALKWEYAIGVIA